MSDNVTRRRRNRLLNVEIIGTTRYSVSIGIKESVTCVSARLAIPPHILEGIFSFPEKRMVFFIDRKDFDRSKVHLCSFSLLQGVLELPIEMGIFIIIVRITM